MNLALLCSSLFLSMLISIFLLANECYATGGGTGILGEDFYKKLNPFLEFMAKYGSEFPYGNSTEIRSRDVDLRNSHWENSRGIPQNMQT